MTCSRRRQAGDSMLDAPRERPENSRPLAVTKIDMRDMMGGESSSSNKQGFLERSTLMVNDTDMRFAAVDAGRRVRTLTANRGLHVVRGVFGEPPKWKSEKVKKDKSKEDLRLFHFLLF